MHSQPVLRTPRCGAGVAAQPSRLGSVPGGSSGSDSCGQQAGAAAAPRTTALVVCKPCCATFNASVTESQSWLIMEIVLFSLHSLEGRDQYVVHQ